VKSSLFLVSGVVERLRGTDRLERLGGLWSARAGLGLLFLVPALSLAGIPPLSGFWAKLVLLRAGVESGAWGMVACAAGVGVLTLFSMTKIWSEAFWKAEPEGAAAPAPPGRAAATALLLPVAGLALLVVAFGLAAGPVVAIAERAAADLSDPSAYLQAVLRAEGRR
jgi:multicomponent Na+:H+ antiporter subunit D